MQNIDFNYSLFIFFCVLIGAPTYLGQLDGNTDIGSLAGRTLIVTERDGTKRIGHHSLQKAASVGYRSRQSKFFSSASTEEAFDPDSNKTGKQAKQKWSIQLFGGGKVGGIFKIIDEFFKQSILPIFDMN